MATVDMRAGDIVNPVSRVKSAYVIGTADAEYVQPEQGFYWEPDTYNGTLPPKFFQTESKAKRWITMWKRGIRTTKTPRGKPGPRNYETKRLPHRDKITLYITHVRFDYGIGVPYAGNN